jgi:beta-glucanase (GH16 family)
MLSMLSGLGVVLFVLLSPLNNRAVSGSFCDPDDVWKADWSDEFHGTELSAKDWNVVAGNEVGPCRNAECLPGNVHVEDGELVLTSRREKSGKLNFTTGAVTTRGKHGWRYTPAFRLCVRAKLPGGGPEAGAGQGIWPAHWMMPDEKSCDPDLGEMDILEMIDGDGVAHGTYHWETTFPAHPCSYPKGHKDVTASQVIKSFATEFHEYAVEHSHTHVAYVYDGVTILNKSSTSPEKPIFWPPPFYLILNTAIGGSWPGPPSEKTVFPTEHRIDYVRVSRKEK